MALDILIKNGKIIDGLGTPAYEADGAIKNGRIEKIGFLGDPNAEITIDAGGLCVAPGFIDINNASDRYGTLLSHPDLESHLRQGVTTIIGGNCGSSLAPLTTGDIILNIQKWADVSKINVGWLTVAEFFSELEKRSPMLNFGMLVGHSTLRRDIARDEFRKLTEKEFAQTKRLLETALRQGASGLSLGLNYSHAKIAPPEELNGLVSILKKNQLLSVHLRDEGKNLYESVSEVVELAKKTEVGVEISHFKSIGRENWPAFGRSLALIEDASENIDINFDIYPYDATATVLYTLLPDWVAVGGRAKLVENLKNSDLKNKIVDELKNREGDYKNIIVASGNIDRIFVGKTVGEIARVRGGGIIETIIDLLVAADGKMVVFWPALSEDNFIAALKSPLSIIASDGAAYNLNDSYGGFLAHPRSFGCFARVLGRYVRGKKVIGLEEAVKKMTALPAAKANLVSRGALKPGYFADVAIFNSDSILDTATFDNPFQYPIGIHSVIINGRVALSDGKIKNQGLGRLL